MTIVPHAWPNREFHHDALFIISRPKLVQSHCPFWIAKRERENEKYRITYCFFAKLCVYRVSLFHSFTILFFFYIVCLCVQILVAHDFPTRETRLFSLSSSAETRQSKIPPVFLFFLFFVSFLFLFFLQSGLEIATRISTGSISEPGERTSKRNVVRSREEESGDRAGIISGSRDRRREIHERRFSIFGIRHFLGKGRSLGADFYVTCCEPRAWLYSI